MSSPVERSLRRRRLSAPSCVPPLPIHALTREWKDVGPNMILSQSLHRQLRVWISVSLEVLQPGSSCHHALAPTYSDAPIDLWDTATEEPRRGSSDHIETYVTG